MRRLGAVAFGTVLAAAFYLLLIDTVSSPELYAMAGVIVLAAIATAASVQQGFSEATIRPRWLRYAYRPVLQVPRQMLLVGREAFAQLVAPQPARGRLRAIAFAAGDSGPDVGRRALTEILGSLAPNTIVIGVDTDRGLLLVHELHSGPAAGDPDVLRLG